MRALSRLTLAAVAWLAADPSWAHEVGGAPGAPPGWTFAPWIVAPLMLSLGVFALGWPRLYARTRRGRSGLERRRRLFAAGWLLVAAALVSPLHQAGERSFALHMLEHELLMLGGAPLLVLSEPLSIMLWAFPGPARRTFGRAARSAPVRAPWRTFTEPVTATLVQATALWLWHMPTLFDLALADPGWHAAQHLSFLLSALFFWSAMLPRGDRTRRSGGRALAALCLFATSVISGALGAFMAFSESPWYAGYAQLGMAPFGLTPAEDQQLAGLIMWAPGGLVHAGAALAVLAGALRAPSVAERTPADA